MIDKVKNIKSEVIAHIGSDGNIDDINDFISEKVYRAFRKEGCSLDECVNISNDIYNSMFKLDIIQKYIDDIDVSEIMINGLDPIIIEKKGKVKVTGDCFDSLQKLENIVQTITSKVNKRVNALTPIVDVRLEDGSRVNIVLYPVALNGPIVTIRKFNNSKFNLDYLVSIASLTEESSDLLKRLIEAKYNIFISGGTSSGKTTFLNSLSEHIPKDDRVITIEDSAELDLKNIYNLVSLETKASNLEGEGEITMEELIKSSLRMRPDRIIVGEVRGKEAIEMLNAMNTGHDGSLSTGHGNSAKDMLMRLELMVLRAVEIPIVAVRQLIASSIEIIIHLERDMQGKRVVKEIVELINYSDEYQLNVLYKIKNGMLVKENELSNKQKMMKAGGT